MTPFNRRPIDFVTLSGKPLLRWLPALAKLRIQVFQAFPYLYEGSAEYEANYLATYAKAEGAVIVIALDQDQAIGAATALPLIHEPEEVRQAVADAGLDVATTFYFGESVLEQPFRGRGIGVRFFELREQAARQSGTFTHAVFCGVVRPDDHPRRPPGYVPLDDFWRKRGFRPLAGAKCHFSWQDLDQTVQTPKEMRFWVKDLR